VHDQAYAWVLDNADLEAGRVLDIGARDLNGSTRDLFRFATTYRTLDILPGPGVDIVADAATWTTSGEEFDVVVCTEVFEHSPQWPAIVATAFSALVGGGQFVCTMAGPGRPEHSAIDGGWVLHPGEYYGNVTAAALAAAMKNAGFVDVVTEEQPRPADTRGIGRRPLGKDQS
jgi:hypothetical protein